METNHSLFDILNRQKCEKHSKALKYFLTGRVASDLDSFR